jgi:hypothetical protein
MATDTPTIIIIIIIIIIITAIGCLPDGNTPYTVTEHGN